VRYQLKIKNCKGSMLALALAVSPAWAQVASHAPTVPQPVATTNSAPAASPALSPVWQVSDKPVARVNGAVLTDRDLLREMLTIFPYARQHNGFPKMEEGQIRQGALKMIEFEELVYQEAERRKMTVAPAKLNRAEAEFKTQFPTQEAFEQYLKTDVQGSQQLLRQRIRRSLLVDELMKQEVSDKSKVSPAELHAYYDKNPNSFRYEESFAIQTISIMPAGNASEEVKKDARKRADDAWRQAKATKSYEEFGLLAEKISEDDYRVNMGDHHAVERAKLPPEIVKAALAMQPGEVSDVMQFGSFYCFFRLDTHTPAGEASFEQVKERLSQALEKQKYESLRAGLDKKLRQNAKVEEL